MVRMTLIDTSPFVYAEEYPNSDTNSNQKRQATDDTSNDGNHFR